ncbi:hypothetical protein OK074_0958 [Actinobacteria bacterium OK074]|nr:hypothetical protein OK074_0958 [Actinobacteria bacterium OK074]
MLDLRTPVLPPELGERLTREAYRRDFWAREGEIRDGGSWKLERRQHFEEVGSPSRDALSRGDWEEALRIFEERRADLAAKERENELRGYVFHRARVVERPLTPYMQWQLHSFRQRAEFGERIRMVPAELVAAAEEPGRLPDVTILGGHTLYHNQYSETGAPVGAVRYTDPEVVESWEHYIRALYAAGEDIASYFEREVAPLPSPFAHGTE